VQVCGRLWPTRKTPAPPSHSHTQPRDHVSGGRASFMPATSTHGVGCLSREGYTAHTRVDACLVPVVFDSILLVMDWCCRKSMAKSSKHRPNMHVHRVTYRGLHIPVNIIHIHTYARGVAYVWECLCDLGCDCLSMDAVHKHSRIASKYPPIVENMPAIIRSYV
jgi:hypothetical protein